MKNFSNKFLKETSKIANMLVTRPFAVLTLKPGQDRKVAATRDA